MATTVKLVGSSYQTDTGGSVSSASNMYNYVSNGDPAHFRTATYNYVKMILNGFDFSVIPNNAVIESVEYKIKLGEASNNNYGTVQLKGAKNSNPTSEEVTLASKTSTTYIITPTVDFDTIREYGSSFGFCIKANYTDADIRVYGAEIDVTYTIPPSVNKVDYIKDGVLKTLIDLTGDDTLPEDVTAGKIFHLADGRQAVGTGGGLEYETGTWSPSSNTTTSPTINFANTHTKPPCIFAISDVSTSSRSSGWFIKTVGVDFSELISSWGMPSSGTWYAAVVAYTNSASSTTETTAVTSVRYGGANTTNSSTSYWRYFATTTGFNPRSNQLFRSTRVYNWIAIWV